MNKKMITTCVDTNYTFNELEEYAREMIIYDIITKLNISEEKALEVAKTKEYNYLATINYQV